MARQDDSGQATAEAVVAEVSVEWGVRWPDGLVRWVPGGEKKAREMAELKGAHPFTRRRTVFLEAVTDWEPVEDPSEC